MRLPGAWVSKLLKFDQLIGRQPTESECLPSNPIDNFIDELKGRLAATSAAGQFGAQNNSPVPVTRGGHLGPTAGRSQERWTCMMIWRP